MARALSAEVDAGSAHESASRQGLGAMPALRWLAGQTALHAGALALGLAVFAALFRTDLASGVTILFYRGLVLLGAAFALTLAACVVLAAPLRRWGVRPRDALGAAVLSLSLNLSFFVLFPVTVDRSISVFLLGRMAAHPAEAFTAERARAEFEAEYLGRYRQIERRLTEQAASGTIAPAGAGYVITPQGQAFIRFSGLVARAFRTDTRFVAGGAETAGAQGAGTAAGRMIVRNAGPARDLPGRREAGGP